MVTNECSVLDSSLLVELTVQNDACLSLTVTRQKRLWKCFYADLKAPVSVSILLEISIANGAVRW